MIAAEIVLPAGRFTVRPSRDADASAVTEVIHDAFSIWKDRGLKFRPMVQTVEETLTHLHEGGFVAERDGAIVGTFSVELGAVRRLPDGAITFTEGEQTNTFAAVGRKLSLPAGALLVFKKAAVRRDLAGSGLGGRLFQLAEDLARSKGRAGLALETAREADWLFAWYERLGFNAVGAYRYPGSAVETILMVKAL